MSVLYYLYLHQRVKKYIYYRQYRHTVGVLSASRIKKCVQNRRFLRPEVMIFASKVDWGVHSSPIVQNVYLCSIYVVIVSIKTASSFYVLESAGLYFIQRFKLGMV